MSEFKFIKYEATPKEKHIGIMTVLVRGIVLRYKIIKTKDGSSLFPASASYKMSGDDEEARYLSAFALDSNSEQEMLFDFIKEKIIEVLSREHQKSNTLNDLSFSGNISKKDSKTQYGNSNAGIETSEDFPF